MPTTDWLPRSIPSLRRKPERREISAYDDIADKSAGLGGFPEIGCRQSTAGDLVGTLSRSADGWAEVSQKEVLCIHPLRHGAEIGGVALAIIDLRRHSTVAVRPHHRMHRRVHD